MEYDPIEFREAVKEATQEVLGTSQANTQLAYEVADRAAMLAASLEAENVEQQAKQAKQPPRAAGARRLGARTPEPLKGREFIRGADEEIIGPFDEEIVGPFDDASRYAGQYPTISVLAPGALGWWLGGPLVGVIGAGVGYWLSHRGSDTVLGAKRLCGCVICRTFRKIAGSKS